MSEYYAYANDSEEEEIMQLEYEKECMKNYPLTWENFPFTLFAVFNPIITGGVSIKQSQNVQLVRIFTL